MGNTLGQLPEGYSKAVHGPYDPSVFYGKKDVPLGQVKLQEVPSWISRRDMTPTAIGRAISRAYWRWNFKYCLPKYCGLTPFVQCAVGCSAIFYLLNYNSIKTHRNAKYHW